VPNGWAGRKDELADIRRNSRTEAERLTEAVFEPDCREARMAMEAAMEFVVSPLTLPRDRIVGMRTVLEFTVPKPVQVAVLTGGDALGFLRQLADVRTTREATKRG
jgi:NifB/MoaA-like Fe-S oxidoreductase